MQLVTADSVTAHKVMRQSYDCRHGGLGATHRIPLLSEVISIVDEEVTPVHMNEGAHAEVLGPIALLPLQLLALSGDMEVLHNQR